MQPSYCSPSSATREASATRAAPSPQTERALHGNEDPGQPKKKKITRQLLRGFLHTKPLTPSVHALLEKWKKHQSLSRVQLFTTPLTVAHQAPLSMGFPRQDYWSGLPFTSPGDLPNPGIEPKFLAWQADFLPLSHLGSPLRSVQFSSVAQSCLTLCNPMNHSMPGLPVQHQLLEFTQTQRPSSR